MDRKREDAREDRRDRREDEREENTPPVPTQLPADLEDAKPDNTLPTPEPKPDNSLPETEAPSQPTVDPDAPVVENPVAPANPETNPVPEFQPVEPTDPEATPEPLPEQPEAAPVWEGQSDVAQTAPPAEETPQTDE